ncbi:hypothetical protein SPRG_19857 [Saprolegnia parasitica CBS 223.65]|uniref:Cyclic nucleotide-binding domain-containing protein n=1 Tax=Saprolegnia parasitica (strain CBS 223.65) TaxID=695850 RepID=A0A067CTY3_SAPPC|nr:hypothetical protein SPRG_19857 [Saprolegnia parasitica CBS 223.65]KDO30011.1 hypothetical protein SPRG_19857 [Saprolegnia parasitica CBS 223.65]|eukprot:XP_012199365.1 hypothetical protein SPRG_19857 [Saprolegnia parasitica CBS 223.65]
MMRRGSSNSPRRSPSRGKHESPSRHEGPTKGRHDEVSFRQATTTISSRRPPPPRMLSRANLRLPLSDQLAGTMRSFEKGRMPTGMRSDKAIKLLGADKPTGSMEMHRKRPKRRSHTPAYDKRFRDTQILEGASKFEGHENEWENYLLGSFIGVANEVMALRKKRKEQLAKYVVLPDSSFRKVWDAVLIVSLLYVAIFLPLQLSFLSDLMTYEDLSNWAPFFAVDRLTDAIFLTDIAINFRTPHTTPKGDLEFDARTRAHEYLTTWFPIDLISIVPFDYFATFLPSGGGNSNLLKLPRLLRMFRLTKILKIVVASRIFKRYEMRISIKYGWIRLIKFAAGILLLTHWMACFVYLVAIMTAPQATWLSTASLNGGLTSEHYLGDAYIAAVYWAAMTITTIGYGDIYPANTTERALFVIMMFLGACVYAYVVGTMCQLVEGLNVNTLEFQRRMDEVNDFLDVNNIPQNLRIRIRKYLLYKRDAKIGDIAEVLHSMSPAIRDEVALFKFQHILSSVHQFRGAPPDFLAAIALRLQMMVYPPNEMIMVFGRIGTSMYIINRGRCQVERMASDGRIVVVNVLHEGAYFGERGLLFSAKRRASVRALCFVEVSCLTRSALEDVTNNFPSVRRIIRKSMVRDVVARSLATGELVALGQDPGFLQRHNQLREQLAQRHNKSTTHDTSAPPPSASSTTETPAPSPDPKNDQVPPTVGEEARSSRPVRRHRGSLPSTISDTRVSVLPLEMPSGQGHVEDEKADEFSMPTVARLLKRRTQSVRSNLAKVSPILPKQARKNASKKHTQTIMVSVKPTQVTAATRLRVLEPPAHLHVVEPSPILDDGPRSLSSLRKLSTCVIHSSVESLRSNADSSQSAAEDEDANDGDDSFDEVNDGFCDMDDTEMDDEDEHVPRWASQLLEVVANQQRMLKAMAATLASVQRTSNATHRAMRSSSTQLDALDERTCTRCTAPSKLPQ